jgi:hypothetical protein
MNLFLNVDAYTTKELVFTWMDKDPVVTASNLDPSPYKLEGIGNDYCNSKTATGKQRDIESWF